VPKPRRTIGRPANEISRLIASPSSSPSPIPSFRRQRCLLRAAPQRVPVRDQQFPDDRRQPRPPRDSHDSEGSRRAPCGRSPSPRRGRYPDERDSVSVLMSRFDRLDSHASTRPTAGDRRKKGGEGGRAGEGGGGEGRKEINRRRTRPTIHEVIVYHCISRARPTIRSTVYCIQYDSSGRDKTMRGRENRAGGGGESKEFDEGDECGKIVVAETWSQGALSRGQHPGGVFRGAV